MWTIVGTQATICLFSADSPTAYLSRMIHCSQRPRLSFRTKSAKFFPLAIGVCYHFRHWHQGCVLFPQADLEVSSVSPLAKVPSQTLHIWLWDCCCLCQACHHLYRLFYSHASVDEISLSQSSYVSRSHVTQFLLQMIMHLKFSNSSRERWVFGLYLSKHWNQNLVTAAHTESTDSLSLGSEFPKSSLPFLTQGFVCAQCYYHCRHPFQHEPWLSCCVLYPDFSVFVVSASYPA